MSLASTTFEFAMNAMFQSSAIMYSRQILEISCLALNDIKSPMGIGMRKSSFWRNACICVIRATRSGCWDSLKKHAVGQDMLLTALARSRSLYCVAQIILNMLFHK